MRKTVPLGSEPPMPRHTHGKQSHRRSRTPERTTAPRQQRSPARDVDAQALTLRESGSSFSAIARILQLGRATDAHRCFVRALQGHEDMERRHLLNNEAARLDVLEQRIRDRDAADPAKVERRLLGVARLREALER